MIILTEINSKLLGASLLSGLMGSGYGAYKLYNFGRKRGIEQEKANIDAKKEYSTAMNKFLKAKDQFNRDDAAIDVHEASKKLDKTEKALSRFI